MQLIRFPLPRPGAAAVALGLFLPALVTGLAAGRAEAQARPNTLAMSCRNAAGLVSARGAIVLGTGPNIYDRYVREIRFCSGSEQLKPEWVKTQDNPQCFIGYTCYVPSRDNFQSR